MEDYKKKYEHALDNFKRIKDANKDNNELVDFIEYEYPELKESNDERIRKEILEYFKQFDKEYNVELRGVNISDWIAWLEKQGEKIDTIENFNTEFEKQVSHLIASVINKEHEYNEGFVKWTANALLNYAKHELEKQGEQKTTDKIEPKFKVGDVVRNISNGDTVTITQIDKENQFYNYSGWDGAATVHSDFSFAEQEEWQLIEQKPTMCLDNIDKDLLKSAKSQLKPAWSEEDEDIFNDIIMCLDGNFKSDKSMIKWLKSFKQRMKGE